jgi:hypothetical protein
MRKEIRNARCCVGLLIYMQARGSCDISVTQQLQRPGLKWLALQIATFVLKADGATPKQIHLERERGVLVGVLEAGVKCLQLQYQKARAR